MLSDLINFKFELNANISKPFSSQKLVITQSLNKTHPFGLLPSRCTSFEINTFIKG